MIFLPKMLRDTEVSTKKHGGFHSKARRFLLKSTEVSTQKYGGFCENKPNFWAANSRAAS